jgi:CRP-like cAMP-binding protein
MYVV